MAVVTKTLKESGGDYTSMITWESTEQTDLVSDGDTHVLECYDYDSSPLNEEVLIAGWTTGASNYIVIKAAAGHGHEGVQGTGFHLSQGGLFKTTLENQQAYTRIEGLRVSNTRTSSNGDAIKENGGDGVQINGNICSVTSTVEGACIVLSKSGAPSPRPIAMNNVCLSGYRGIGVGSFRDADILNNTVIGCVTGIFSSSSGVDADVKNNVAHGNTTDWSTGTITGTVSHNRSEDGTTPGTDTGTDTVGDDFVTYSTDLTPANAGELDSNGTDTSLTVTIDITGTARSSDMDIGAYIAAAPAFAINLTSGSVDRSVPASTVGSITSDTAGGTLYWIAQPSTTTDAPTSTEIKAGQNGDGGAATHSGSI